MNILDNYTSLRFCLNTFGIRPSIDVLDSDPGETRAYKGRLTPKVGKQKSGILELSKISLNCLLRCMLFILSLF